MNVKIIRKLGSGVMGTVYLSEIDGVPAITKIEKYDGDITTKASYIRQLIFNDAVAQHHPDRFMTLVSSGVINMCDHKQKLPNFMKGAKPAIKAHHKLRDSWNKCCVLSYKPVLAHTLRSVADKLSDDQKLVIFKHLKKSIEIMQKAGFKHRDIHHNNIMCDKTMKKWYIIDYGAIWHKSFIPNFDDGDNVMGIDGNDLSLPIWFFLKNPVFDYVEEKMIKLPLYKTMIAHIMADKRYTIIKKYLPKIRKDTFLFKNCITQACALLFYDLYIEALGMSNTAIGKKYKDLQQPNKTYFLNIIKSLK